MNKGIIFGIVGIAGSMVFLTVVLLFAGEVSNCGGNSAALSNCRSYVQGALVSGYDSPEHIFNIEHSAMRGFLLEIAADTGWIGDGEYLIRTGDFSIGDGNQGILIVSGKAFTNVPKRFWKSNPPTHAAGLADGSAVLLSKSEFESLNLESFVSGSRLYAKHKESQR